MIRSMTGFGEASLHDERTHYYLELRSLNSKYLKVAIRLPEEFQSLEAELESEVRARLSRGTVTLTGTCSSASASAAHEINQEALSRYIEQLRQNPSLHGGSEAMFRLDIGSILMLPGVLQPPGDEEERHHAARAAFLSLLARAAEGLVQMRDKEGLAVREELRRQRDLIIERLGLIGERAPAVVQEYERRLQTRIESLLRTAEIKVDGVDVIREIAAYAERTDINEELSRLAGHMDQFDELISADEPRPVGRTLDFLAQEMLREANTIASKSPDAEISRASVEIKGAIDRIKELVQNVE